MTYQFSNLRTNARPDDRRIYEALEVCGVSGCGVWVVVAGGGGGLWWGGSWGLVGIGGGWMEVGMGVDG